MQYTYLDKENNMAQIKVGDNLSLDKIDYDKYKDILSIREGLLEELSEKLSTYNMKQIEERTLASVSNESALANASNELLDKWKKQLNEEILRRQLDTVESFKPIQNLVISYVLPYPYSKESIELIRSYLKNIGEVSKFSVASCLNPQREKVYVIVREGLDTSFIRKRLEGLRAIEYKEELK